MPLFQFAFNSGLLGFTPRNIFNFFRIEILPSHENGRCALFTPELSFELFRKWLLQFQFAFNWVLFPASFSSTLKFQPGFSFCSETGLWRYGSDAVWKKSRLCFFIFLCFCVSSTTWPAHFFGPSWWWDIKCHLSYMHIHVHLSNNPCILVFQLQPDLLCSHLLGPSYGDGWMLLPDEQVSF